MSISHMQSADWSRTIKPNTVTAEYSSFMNNLFAIVRPKTTKSNCTFHVQYVHTSFMFGTKTNLQRTFACLPFSI